MTNSQPSLLSKPYEQKTFLEFLKNQFLTDGFSQRIEDLDCEAIDNIKTFRAVTKIGWDESLDLEIIEIEHQKDNDPRISLTKGIHRLMSYYGYESALVVFKVTGSDRWRLSLVTQEYEVKLTGKVARKYSNPKRYSFALGKDIKIKTAQQYLMKGNVQGMTDLRSRFSVEALNKEFYKQIKEQYDNLCRQIQLPNPKMDSQEVENNRKDFALRLIGRLIFCWFLRAKSWITDDVLSSQSVDNYNNLGGYYHRVLELLFFDTLNQAVENRATDIQDNLKNALKKIPYLNGGLFEPKESDHFDKSQLEFSDRINHQLRVPNEVIKSILGLFEEYHFTVDESTSSDQEIGIDPEMMGKVFENFILDRSAKGAFYTPREIVDYMVDSALQESVNSKFQFQKFDTKDFLDLLDLDLSSIKERISINNREKVLIDNYKILPFKISKYNILKNLGIAYKNKSFVSMGYTHPEVTSNTWLTLVNGTNATVINRFFAKPKNIELGTKKILVPKLGLTIEIEGKLFVTIFSISLGGYLLLDTIHGTDAKKIDKLKRDSSKNLALFLDYMTKISPNKNTLQESEFIKIWQGDAATPIVTIDRQLRAFSDFCQSYAHIIDDKKLVVKLGQKATNTSGLSFQLIENILISAPDSLETATRHNIITHLSSLKVFDPACGSGAFPMGILQKLTEIIHTLDETQSIYNIKKSILENCIYGVDIMPIAVEISRLRCWLSLLVDEVTPEPLPNLEFKFACANSLIGIKKEPKQSIDTRLEDLEDDLENLRKETFRPQQSKIELSKKWAKITNELYRLQIETGFYKSKDASTDLTSWNPFENKPASFFDPEWMFGVKGFDIVLGNPPYGAIVSSQEKQYYKNNYYSAKTDGDGKGSQDTFVVFSDLAITKISKPNAVISYIVPMSITSSDAMNKLHKLLFSTSSKIYISSYSDRPKKIFNSAETACSVIIITKGNSKNLELMTTKVNKRYSNKESVDKIIQNLTFVDCLKFVQNGRIPKISTNVECKIINTLKLNQLRLNNYLDDDGSGFYYRTSGGRYYKMITNFSTGSSKERCILLQGQFTNLMCAIFSSNLYFWFYHIYSNNLDLKTGDIDIFPIPDLSKIDSHLKEQIENTYTEYLIELEKNSEIQSQKRANVSEVKIYYARKSKYLIDKLDRLICPLYGLTQEQTDWVINFDIKFRTDSEE